VFLYKKKKKKKKALKRLSLVKKERKTTYMWKTAFFKYITNNLFTQEITHEIYFSHTYVLVFLC